MRYLRPGTSPNGARFWTAMGWCSAWSESLDDIPSDKQMLENDVLVPFEGGEMLTINSPIWVDGSKKKPPRHAPGVGEHSDEVLRMAGYDERRSGNCGRRAPWLKIFSGAARPNRCRRR